MSAVQDDREPRNLLETEHSLYGLGIAFIAYAIWVKTREQGSGRTQKQNATKTDEFDRAIIEKLSAAGPDGR